MSVKLYIGWCYVGRPSTSFTNIILAWKFGFLQTSKNIQTINLLILSQTAPVVFGNVRKLFSFYRRRNNRRV